MPVSPVTAIWIGSALFAVVALTKLMRGRQSQLMSLLNSWVQKQAALAKKKAAAIKAARKAAAAIEERERNLKEMLGQMNPETTASSIQEKLAESKTEQPGQEIEQIV